MLTGFADTEGEEVSGQGEKSIEQEDGDVRLCPVDPDPLVGDDGFETLHQKTGQRIPVRGPCRIAERSVGLLECTAGKIADYYFWTGSHGPTMEFQSPNLTIPPDESLRFVFLFTPCRARSGK